MACGAAEQLGVVWGCGLALGVFPFSFPAGPRGRVRSREGTRAKKDMRVAWLGKGARVPESRPGAARFRILATHVAERVGMCDAGRGHTYPPEASQQGSRRTRTST